MTARQVIAHWRYRRAVHAKQQCCGGLCSTSVEARATRFLCPCGCGRPPGQHNPNVISELRSAA
ncbi:hypothetical protein [Kitasatospora kifunensis]|uniref:Uncharacterized protein n=1 Tax=Kitasatospora kifunensis TaxID=58351 RepID=A0A7W7VTC4_KITKI|nr:hypothetical protein [Kitasatospora kifunensis]MBB4922141.1 hypothetical protein [Kitasatospora kifunensis]